MGKYKAPAEKVTQTSGRSPRAAGKARPRHQRREERREEALDRGDLHKARTPAQQLAVLDKRLGKGKGAVKERARLEAMLRAG